MQTIWKYPIDLADNQTISLPERSKILHVAEQGGALFLWALVDPAGRGKIDHAIEIFGTGFPIPQANGRSYVGSVLTANGNVWHVFARVPQ